ncbi:hypothetical protein [Streptomyces flavofungini]|uniref:hypothetical protein n=1 Tax=Streptomyces flavofungini TaxID=68200 RepID=UPI0025B1D3DA|nr:hypothetical protein [Streptomyces flavofungini]WJV47141.1 hypothetical protein QUY26_17410 [Streptomyces flavofungini]
MFRRRARADREFREAQRAGFALLQMHAQEPWSFDGVQTPVAPTDATEGPDFLPPEFRAPCRQDVSGFMMRWDLPLVIDGEVHACHCGAYRNWIVFNMRDDSVWLRCEAGHEAQETRLDTAWYNRNSGPVDRFHPTLEDGLRHLGH